MSHDWRVLGVRSARCGDAAAMPHLSVIKEKFTCKGCECPPTDDNMTGERERERGGSEVIPIWSVELSQSSPLYLSQRLITIDFSSLLHSF